MGVAVAFEVRCPMAADAFGGGRREGVAAGAVVAVRGGVVGDRGSHAVEVAEIELVVDAAASDRPGRRSVLRSAPRPVGRRGSGRGPARSARTSARNVSSTCRSTQGMPSSTVCRPCTWLSVFQSRIVEGNSASGSRTMWTNRASGKTSSSVFTRAVCVGDLRMMRRLRIAATSLDEQSQRLLPALALGVGERHQVEILVGDRAVVGKRPGQVRRRDAHVAEGELVFLRAFPAGFHAVHRPRRGQQPAQQRRDEPLRPEKVVRREALVGVADTCAARRGSTARAVASCRSANGRARTAAARPAWSTARCD